VAACRRQNLRVPSRRVDQPREGRLELHLAALPMPPEEYIDDFDSPEARQEFNYLLSHRTIETIVMPPSATRDESYEKVGYYVARHCDVMIAVYDGQPSQGRGGTADIVDEVKRLGRPLCHVWAGKYKSDTAKKRTEVSDQGKVTFHNFA